MATRFHFTTRDWFWLCLVFALAFGWGGHFRYSAWLEEHLIANRSASLSYDDELARQLKAAHEELAQERTYAQAMEYATRKMSEDNDRREVSKLIKEYYDSHGIPRPVDRW